jgi:hypothetical protein
MNLAAKEVGSLAARSDSFLRDRIQGDISFALVNHKPDGRLLTCLHATGERSSSANSSSEERRSKDEARSAIVLQTRNPLVIGRAGVAALSSFLICVMLKICEIREALGRAAKVSSRWRCDFSSGICGT